MSVLAHRPTVRRWWLAALLLLAAGVAWRTFRYPAELNVVWVEATRWGEEPYVANRERPRFVNVDPYWRDIARWRIPLNLIGASLERGGLVPQSVFAMQCGNGCRAVGQWQGDDLWHTCVPGEIPLSVTWLGPAFQSTAILLHNSHLDMHGKLVETTSVATQDWNVMSRAVGEPGPPTCTAHRVRDRKKTIATVPRESGLLDVASFEVDSVLYFAIAQPRSLVVCKFDADALAGNEVLRMKLSARHRRSVVAAGGELILVGADSRGVLDVRRYDSAALVARGDTTPFSTLAFLPNARGKRVQRLQCEKTGSSLLLSALYEEESLLFGTTRDCTVVCQILGGSGRVEQFGVRQLSTPDAYLDGDWVIDSSSNDAGFTLIHRGGLGGQLLPAAQVNEYCFEVPLLEDNGPSQDD